MEAPQPARGVRGAARLPPRRAGAPQGHSRVRLSCFAHVLVSLRAFRHTELACQPRWCTGWDLSAQVPHHRRCAHASIRRHRCIDSVSACQSYSQQQGSACAHAQHLKSTPADYFWWRFKSGEDREGLEKVTRKVTPAEAAQKDADIKAVRRARFMVWFRFRVYLGPGEGHAQGHAGRAAQKDADIQAVRRASFMCLRTAAFAILEVFEAAPWL